MIGEDNAVLATFTVAKCKKSTRNKTTSFFADAVSTDRKYELSVDIFRAFTGFHKYDLTLDAEANPILRFNPVGDYRGGVYSNTFVPSHPVPGFGRVNFSSNGKRMGVGFGPAMWSRDTSRAVVVAGGLECRYPKRRAS